MYSRLSRVIAASQNVSFVCNYGQTRFNQRSDLQAHSSA
jgi:hypothetical protein